MALPPVEVAWIDSQSETGWRTVESALREAAGETLACWTCGYLVEDTDEYVLLALNRTEPGSGSKPMVGDTILIPRVAVVKVRKLR